MRMRRSPEHALGSIRDSQSARQIRGHSRSPWQAGLHPLVVEDLDDNLLVFCGDGLDR